MEPTELQVPNLAEAQHGIITRRQALAIGMTSRMIEGRLIYGRWKRLGTGTYAVNPGDGHWRVLAAATTALPAVVSHESAAALPGFAHVRNGRWVVTAPIAGL